MSLQLVWGEDDHKDRAQLLAVHGNTNAISIQDGAQKIAGLDTLLFWGHGLPGAFCGLKPHVFLDTVNAWKKANKTLNTIEMLTCNIQHGGLTGQSFNAEFVNCLKKKHAGLTFKSLPVFSTKNGNTCTYSILKWHPQSSTWAYVASDNETTMFGAVIALEDHVPPRGTKTSYMQAFGMLPRFQLTKTHPYATKRNFTDKQVQAYNDKLKDTLSNSSIIVGAIGSLRWYLQKFH